MNRRALGLAAAGVAALFAGAMALRTDSSDPLRAHRRAAPSRVGFVDSPSAPPASSRVPPLERRAAGRRADPSPDPAIALRAILHADPEKFLDLIEQDAEAYELACRRLFPRGGALDGNERQVLLESLWSMALGGRRAAALLAGRFELEEPFLKRVVDFVRSTADGQLASWIVQGLRESRPNLIAAGADLAEAIRFQLRLRADPQLLGGLADLAGLAKEKIQARDWIGLFAMYLGPGAPEDLRLQAVRGAASWPEAGAPLLLEHFAAETSPVVRLAILRFTARRRESREWLMRAIQSDPDPDVRRFAAESARLSCDAGSVAGLERLAACETDDRVVRALQESIAVLSQKGNR